MRWSLLSLMVGAGLGLNFAELATAQGFTDYRVTYIEVSPSATERATQILSSYAEASLDADGNQLFYALQRIGRSNHFAIVETWGTNETQDTHANSEYANQFRDSLEPLLLSPPDERLHSNLFTAEGASVASAGVFVVTHVDVLPPYTDTAVTLLNTLVSESRGEWGNARFDVWSTVDRPNHMTMIEVWDSLDARERHVTAAHTKAFRSSLSPLNGALYDERLYRAL